MNRISAAFQKYSSEKKTFVIPYITPEFPIPGVTIPLILALESAGAAMIEIGIPFSDPLADGPTIQHSSEVAIRNGASLKRVLAIVKEARTKTNIPLLFMGYVNPILNHGMGKFCADAKDAGIDGMIIPDLPPEESGEFRSLCTQHGLSNVFLIAPTSSDERIRYIDGLSTDFTYCVSVTGVTGSVNTFGSNFDGFLTRVKNNTKKPFVVGFGIKSREQVTQISETADGVVVGSALLQAIGGEKSAEAVTAAAKQFLSTIV